MLMQTPPGRDFEHGRACAAALREIFLRSGDGDPAPATLERALRLCALARSAVHDEHCRARADMVRDHAVLLFGGEQRWLERRSLGPQVLRLQALKLLGSYERWLAHAETQELLAEPQAPQA